MYSVTEGFAFNATCTNLNDTNPVHTSMISKPSATTDSYNYNGTQRVESVNSSSKAETYNVTGSYYNMSRTNTSSIDSYAFGNGTHIAYYDCPPGTEPSPFCWGKILFCCQIVILQVRFV